MPLESLSTIEDHGCNIYRKGNIYQIFTSIETQGSHTDRELTYNLLRVLQCELRGPDGNMLKYVLVGYMLFLAVLVKCGILCFISRM